MDGYFYFGGTRVDCNSKDFYLGNVYSSEVPAWKLHGELRGKVDHRQTWKRLATLVTVAQQLPRYRLLNVQA